MTDDPDIRIANSLMDYLFRKLAVMYLTPDDRAALGIHTTGERLQPTLPGVEEQVTETVQGQELPPDPPSVPSPSQLVAQLELGVGDAPEEPTADERAPATDRPRAVRSDAPFCMTCGVPMQRAGSCFVCTDCGTTSGCS
jgi:ribonucleoside-diphosphate reductase alpha chain